MKNQLQTLDSQQFLSEYWQKKPCLIRQGFGNSDNPSDNHFDNPLLPDELAGLALEDEVESRIIRGSEPQNDWQLSNGPFTEHDFSQLPEKNWTLLVQAVDHWVPEVRELLEAFRFIPDWRLDDIMVSYAAPGGSVGPHYDQYDVFLIQGYGRREWQLGQHCTEHRTEQASLQNHAGLRLLGNFEAKEHYVLEPGDILYLPPGIAHHGIALDECMTYSVGFRAPSHEEMINHFCDFVAEQLDPQQRYADPDLQLQASSANLSDGALSRVQAILQQALGQPEQISEWFGCYMTEPKYSVDSHSAEQSIEQSSDELQPEPEDILYISATSRLCWHIENHELLFFADGKCWRLNESHQGTIDQLCCQRQHTVQTNQSAEITGLLTELLQQGSLYYN